VLSATITGARLSVLGNRSIVRCFLRNLSSGPLASQHRRFALVGTPTPSVQMVLLWLFVDVGRLNYHSGR